MPSNYYQVGGSLPYNNPNYIVRQADQTLYENIKAGHFCYVLNSRQMGKSSLLLQTMYKLQQEGFHCVALDLSEIGNKGITAKEWYGSIVYKLARNLNIFTLKEFNAWINEHSELSPVKRLSVFIETVVLKKISDKIVIFLDEVDSVLSLEFSGDDLFALIRYFYNKRAENTDYHRLVFAVFGVATSSDLVKDKNRTPFNIGKSIELTGFSLDEALPLASGISNFSDNKEEVLRQVLVWTGGQPFLTQKLCQLILHSGVYIPAGKEAEYIEEIVKKEIIDNWEVKDEPRHLRTICDRLLHNERQIASILGLYKKVLQQREIPIQESEEQTQLKLSGLIVRHLKESKLVVNNCIYESIFNENWVNNILLQLRPYGVEIAAWIDSKGQDESMLLRGETLKLAQHWAKSHILNDEDYKFLKASQELENKELERNLNRELKNKKKVKKINISLIIILFCFLAAGSIILSQYLFLRRTSYILKISQESFTALKTFEYPENQIKSLIIAMKSGQRLAAIVNRYDLPQNYQVNTPLSPLQKILDNIQQKNILARHNSKIWGLSYSPNGQFLATGGEDGKLIIWNRNGELIEEINSGHGEIYSVQFSPDGNIIATAGKDNLVRLWNIDGQLLTTLKGHTGEVYSISFNEQKKYIATAGVDNAVRIWNFQGKQIKDFKYEKELQVRRVSFTPDGNFFVTSGRDGVVRIRDLSNNLVKEIKNDSEDKLKFGFDIDFLLIPGKQSIVTKDSRSQVRLWDYSTKTLIYEFNTLQGTINSMSISHDAKYIATAGSDGKIQIRTLDGNDKIDEYKVNSVITNIIFSPEENKSGYKYRLAIADAKGNVQIIYLKSQFTSKRPAEKPIMFDSIGTFSSAKLSGDAKFLSTSLVNDVKIFNQDSRIIVNSKLENILNTQDITLYDISSKEQKLLVGLKMIDPGTVRGTTDKNGIIKIFKISGQKLVEDLTIQSQASNILTAIFTSDSQQIVTGHENGEVQFWDLSGKQKLLIKEAHRGKVKSITFSPDGKQLATLGEDDKIKIWSREGQLISEFDAPPYNNTIIRFNNDGKLLAVVASVDNFSQVNILVVSGDSAGQTLAEIIVHDLGITVLDVSFLSLPKGEYIVTAGSDNTVKLWRIENLNELLTRGCTWLEEYLVTNPTVKDELKFCYTSK